MLYIYKRKAYIPPNTSHTSHVTWEQQDGFRMIHVNIFDDLIELTCDDEFRKELYRLQNILIDRGIDPFDNNIDDYDNTFRIWFNSEEYFWIEESKFKLYQCPDDYINVNVKVNMSIINNAIAFNINITVPTSIPSDQLDVQNTNLYTYLKTKSITPTKVCNDITIHHGQTFTLHQSICRVRNKITISRPIIIHYSQRNIIFGVTF